MSDRIEAGTWAQRGTKYKPRAYGVTQVCHENLQPAAVIAEADRKHANSIFPNT